MYAGSPLGLASGHFSAQTARRDSEAGQDLDGPASQILIIENRGGGFMTELARVQYGFYIIILGLGAVLIALFAALYRWPSASDVTTVVSSVGAIIGPIVGAFFGLHIGAAGKEKAEQDRDKAIKKVEALMSAIEPAQFDKLRSSTADLFSS